MTTASDVQPARTSHVMEHGMPEPEMWRIREAEARCASAVAKEQERRARKEHRHKVALLEQEVSELRAELAAQDARWQQRLEQEQANTSRQYDRFTQTEAVMTNLSESLKALAQEKSGYSQELRAANDEIDRLKRELSNMAQASRSSASTGFPTSPAKKAHVEALDRTIVELNAQLRRQTQAANESQRALQKAEEDFEKRRTVLETKLARANEKLKHYEGKRAPTGRTIRPAKRPEAPTFMSPIKADEPLRARQQPEQHQQPREPNTASPPAASAFSMTPFFQKTAPVLESPTHVADASTPAPNRVNAGLGHDIDLSPIMRIENEESVPIGDKENGTSEHRTAKEGNAQTQAAETQHTEKEASESQPLQPINDFNNTPEMLKSAPKFGKALFGNKSPVAAGAGAKRKRKLARTGLETALITGEGPDPGLISPNEAARPTFALHARPRKRLATADGVSSHNKFHLVASPVKERSEAALKVKRAFSVRPA